MIFKKSNRVIFRTVIHENTHNEVNIQTEQARPFRTSLRLVGMLLEPLGKSEMFSGRVYSRYQIALDSSTSYHGLTRSKMILMISLHTVDPMLSPLYLLGSDFDHLSFRRVLILELPQTAGISRFDHKLFAILSIT